ncbi:MAG: molybdopterin-dependent oxidoreductase [Desulfitobacterium hafniense]|nr:molybdopterin-dependent oxidoreductase [Desulfitobacterium hafniense]
MNLNRRQFIGLSTAVSALAFAGVSGTKLFEAYAGTEQDDAWIPTHCKACAADNRCHLLVHRVNGVAVKIEGNSDSPTNQGRNCAKSAAALLTLYNPYRVKFPVKRTNPQKGRGIDPKWVEITWDEALNTIAAKLKKVRGEDPRKFVFMTGHAASLNIDTDREFAEVFGTPNVIVGATSMACGGSASPINKIVNGGGQARADMLYCKYFLNLGANSQQGGKGNSEEADAFVNARSRGLKVVNVTPILSPSLAKTDEWVPIIPGTTGYFLLAMINVIVNELKVYDKEFLIKRTNAVYLVGEDGLYLRTNDKLKDHVRGLELGNPLVWDRSDNRAKAFDDPSLNEASLEGAFEIDGKKYRTTFEVLKEHVKEYTPEKGKEITGISPETVRRLAKEWVEEALIGKTITIDGVIYPYRPVAIIAEQGAKCHVDNYMVVHAAKILAELVGATDVPGSAKAAGSPTISINPVDGVNISEEFIYKPLKKNPERISLQDHSPIPGSSSGLAWLTMQDPKAYGFDYTPEVLGIWGGNPQALLGDFEQINKIFKDFPFTFAISYEFDEPTEFADIVLPESSWLERYGLTSFVPKTSFTEVFKTKGNYGWALQQPVLPKPLYNTKEGNQIILELSEKLGILNGKNGLLARLNESVGVREPFLLDLEKKYTWEEIIDLLCKSKTGGEKDLDWFKKNGLVTYDAFTIQKYYGYTKYPKARIPLYLEEFASHRVQLKKELEEKGIIRKPNNEFVLKQFTPLPFWEPHPEHKAAKEYDLYCINYKNMQHHFACNVGNAWLMEMTSEQDPYALNVMINRVTASKRGLKDGDRIEITSFIGGKVQGKVKTTNLIHTDVLGIAGAYGPHSANMNPEVKIGTAFADLLKLSEDLINPLKISLDRDLKVKIRKI